MPKLLAPAALLCILACACAPAQTIVTTSAGRLSGATADGITSFKGIPYAAPPVGPLRWKAPQPAAPWKGVVAADKFASACMQPLRAENPLPTSEDCLYLNIWRPESTKPASKLPVMVWIYGGAFAFGATNNPLYDGASLARHGVLLVTVNYRLGRFGWFAYPELTREGGSAGTADFGLMDDLAALKWVQANIAAFGGDPANVTLFGESAGAMSVNAIMANPANRGLFAKAITESGLGRNLAAPLAAVEKNGVAFAQSAGAADLAALRALPASVVLGSGTPALGSYGPIRDGVLISSDVDRAFAAGTQIKVPWIIGSNDYEASLFAERLADPPAYLAALPDAGKPITALYDPANTGNLKTVVFDLTTDKIFTEPARFLAAAEARSGQPVYRYHFAYVAEPSRKAQPGATHGSEIAFVFDTLGAGRAKPPAFSETDRRTAAIMGLYWTNFAKTGNPNGEGLVPWPKDSPRENEDKLLVIDAAGQHAATAFRKPFLDPLLQQSNVH